jgi:type I restriction enzyme M protein
VEKKMLDSETKRRIDTARDILVGKIPDPKSQIEQITIALIYKFMDDMDKKSEELGGRAKFFTGSYSKYSWSKLMDASLSGFELVTVYGEAIQSMNQNPNAPQLFRDIFKNAYLPYRDPSTLKSFLKIIDDFTYDHSERLGDAFEYLLSVMSSQGDAGQFRTPRHIIEFIVDVVDPSINDTILDPACGTAGFLISAYKHILEKHFHEGKNTLTPDERKKLVENIVGYDISPDMVRLSLVNLYLHGFKNPAIYEYDSLSSDEKWDDTFDICLANPPFMTPKGGIRPHKRFSVSSNRAEVLFVDYMHEHLNNDGRAGIVVPEGIIFQSGKAYKELRKSLLSDSLYAVVSLPAGVFNPYSGVKTSILFLDKKIAKKSKEVLFVKVVADGYNLGAQRREIKENDLPLALEVLKEFQNSVLEGYEPKLEKFEKTIAHIVYKDKIAEQDYNLSGDRYKEAVVYDGNWDLVELGEVCEEIRNGKNVSQSKNKGKYRVTRIQTISDGTIDLDKTQWTDDEVSEEYFMQEGDILLSHINSFEHLGKSAIFKNINEKVIHGVNLIKFRFNKKLINPKYASKVFKSDIFIDTVKSFAQKAVNQASVKTSDLKLIKIPLPPLEVQERIVEEIETYQNIIDGAKKVVESYKPSFKIDPEWEIVELGDISENLDGKRVPITKSDRKEGKYPYYGASGIVDYVDNYIFDEDLLLISEDGANLLARVTPIAFFVSGKIWVNNHAHVLKFPEKATQIFVELYLNSIPLDNYISGSAQPKLNQGALNKIKIPLPPIETQKEIVAQIEEEQKLVDSNKQLIEIFEKKIKDRISEVWGE